MMKKILFTAALAVFLLTGCGDDVDTADAEKVARDNGIDSSKIKQAVQDGSNIDALSDEAIAKLEAKLHSIYFDYDKFQPKSNMASKLENNSGLLSPVAKTKATIKLEGNCDEWGNDEYNFALGLKRAKSVKTSLVNSGIPEDKVTIISLGESSPKCQEKTQSCWAQNRRVDTKILK
jgi:peptidoglycan-associated lipoprotein